MLILEVMPILHQDGDIHNSFQLAVLPRTRTRLIIQRTYVSMQNGSDTFSQTRPRTKIMLTRLLNKRQATAQNHAMASDPNGKNTRRTLLRIRFVSILFQVLIAIRRPIAHFSLISIVLHCSNVLMYIILNRFVSVM